MIDPREHQHRAHGEVRQRYAQGARSIVVVAPTGSGKTVISAMFARSHIERRPDGAVLGIVPRIELASQMAKTMRAMGLRAGVIAGDAEPGEVDPEAPVQVATIQTLHRRGLRPRASLVLPDEFHHYMAPEWLPVIEPYRATSTIVGTTATPCRSDGVGMGNLADSLVVAATVKELLALNLLVPCMVDGPGGRRRALAEHPVRAYLERGRNAAGELRRAIFFARDMAHSRKLAAELGTAGVSASSIESDLAPAVRRERIARFRSGELRALVNIGILTEGFDEPSLEVVVLARGCSHEGALMQMVGRALRPSPETGKTEALLFDLMGVVYDLGMPDDDRVFSLEGKAISRVEGDESIAIRQCGACGGVFRAELYVESACPRCSHKLPAKKNPRVQREQLQRIRATHTETQRVGALVDLMKRGRDKGYKPGWAFVQFSARYRRWPTLAEKQAATGALRGEHQPSTEAKAS